MVGLLIRIGVARGLALLLLLTWPASSMAEGAIAHGRDQAAAAAPEIIPSGEGLGLLDADGNIVLYPGMSGEITLSPDDLFPGAAAGSTEALTRAYGDELDMQELAVEGHRSLLSDPSSAGGQAFGVVVDTRDTAAPDISGDPMWGTTRNVLADLDVLEEEFGHCRRVRRFIEQTVPEHVPQIEICDRVYAPPPQNSVLFHEYSGGIIRPAGGEFSSRSCGPGCLDLYVGRRGDNYWTGDCQVFERWSMIEVFNPSAIRSAHLVEVTWDDYIQLYVENRRVFRGPNNLFPPETEGECELGESQGWNGSIDLTRQFQQRGIIDFRIRVSVTGAGEGFGRIRLRYDPAQVLTVDLWEPPEVVALFAAARDGFCTVDATCTRMPPIVDGCARLNGAIICPSDFLSHDSRLIAPDLNPLCQRARVESDCHFGQGELCWTDHLGDVHCEEGSGLGADTCAPFEDDRSCGFVRSACISGARGESGTCYAYEDVYDCGYSVDTTNLVPAEEMVCAGEIACMGESCVEVDREVNDGFSEAVAMLQTARFASMDTDCETEGTCVVFSGDSMECLRALGGWVDCCEMPAGVNLADYLRLILALGELDDTFGVFGASAEVQGAWEVLSQPVEDAWDWATEPVTSWFNGVTGRTTATTSTGEALGLVGTVEQFMMHNVAEWTLQVFGEGAVNSLFSVVTQHSGVDLATHLGSGTITEGVLQIGGGQAIVGTALSWIGTAYAIYTVADILVRTIWACDEESFQLGVNRQLHQCSFVGSYCATSVIGQCLERRMSYCCFNSPLSRIIQEQARPQLGMDWGDAESPECRGLSVNDLQRVDWDQVDLSEWIALLTETDLMPDLPSDFSADELTGEGRMVLDGIFPEARAPVEDRTRARTGQVDWYDIQRQAYDELWPGAVPACQPNC